jgi:hypothetical protein
METPDIQETVKRILKDRNQNLSHLASLAFKEFNLHDPERDKIGQGELFNDADTVLHNLHVDGISLTPEIFILTAVVIVINFYKYGTRHQEDVYLLRSHFPNLRKKFPLSPGRIDFCKDFNKMYNRLNSVT